MLHLLMRSKLVPLDVTVHGSPQARLPTAVIDAALELLDRNFDYTENGGESSASATKWNKDKQPCFDVTAVSSMLPHRKLSEGAITVEEGTFAKTRSISSESVPKTSDGIKSINTQPVYTEQKVVSIGERNDHSELTPEEKIKRRRVQNRAAAVKCRLKKQQRYQQLLAMTQKLESQNRRMHEQVAELKSALTALEAELNIHTHCKTRLMYFRQPAKAREKFPTALLCAAQSQA